jgi:aminocarboxymuconate-semialdehyde decarboxylase
MFLSRLIFDGVFDRHPGLKVATPHGGGYLPAYYGRTNIVCDLGAECANKKQPIEYLRSQIFADTLIFTEEQLHQLVEVMGASQIIYGTDIPYNWPDTLDLVLNASRLSDPEKMAIVGGNLKRLLKIT